MVELLTVQKGLGVVDFVGDVETLRTVGFGVGKLVSTLVGAEVRLSSELGASVSVERLIVGLILVSSADGLLLGPGIGENYNKREFKYEQFIDKTDDRTFICELFLTVYV